MGNPYNDNSDERADVNDTTDLISATAFNNARETQRYLKYGIQHVDQVSAVYGGASKDLLRSGFDLGNGYLKSAFPKLFVSAIDASPAQTFQDHCLTNRGQFKHIVVDSSVSLGQCNNLINSNTVIEGAFFDNVSGTYKELDVGGVSDTAATIAGAGNPYTLSGITGGNLLTKKINIGDMVYATDGITSAWGEVAGSLLAGGCTVTFYNVPPVAVGTIDVVILKKNITFYRCTFHSQLQILNTWNCVIKDCNFIENYSGSKFGAIFANVPYFGNAGGGAGTYGYTFQPKILDNIFFYETNPGVSTANPSAILADIAIDSAVYAVIHSNRFFNHTPTALNAGRYPIHSNAAYLRAIAGGIATDNTCYNYGATQANIRTACNRVCALYVDHNILNAGVW